MTSCRCKNISNMYWTWAEKFSIKTSMLAFSHHVLFPLWQYSQPHCLCPQDAHITACLLLPPLCFIALIGRCVNKVKWATIIPFFGPEVSGSLSAVALTGFALCSDNWKNIRWKDSNQGRVKQSSTEIPGTQCCLIIIHSNAQQTLMGCSRSQNTTEKRFDGFIQWKAMSAFIWHKQYHALQV